MEFASAAASVVKSIRQRDLLNTWLRLFARERTAPALRDYQPTRLEDEQPDLIYCTVDTSERTPRLTIQVEGARISQAYGRHGKGILLDERIGPQRAPFVMPFYYECIARGLPIYSVADVDDSYGRVVAYERLLLPFQTDGKVSHVIASIKTFCEDGGFEIKNLMNGTALHPRSRLRVVIDRDLFHRLPARTSGADIADWADSSVATEIVELS